MESAETFTLSDRMPRVLFLGPLPPPTGGYVSLFLALIGAWKTCGGDGYSVINTSPGRIKSHPGVKGVRDLVRGVRIAARLIGAARVHDAVVFVATTGLFQRLIPAIRFVGKRYGVPFYAWFSGGVVHDVLAAMPAARKRRLVADLNAMSGVIVETGEVLAGMQALGIEQVTAVPNPRVIDWGRLPPPRTAPALDGGLRLVFLSRIVEDKGIFELIEAVEKAAERRVRIELDVYGPVDPAYATRFGDACRRTPGVHYKGVFHGDATSLLAGYDAVVLPTWFPREGHPGVLVEAMMAGIPVVTTRHMAIPELVTDRENGLLVAPRDVDELVDSFCRLTGHPEERYTMGAAHRARLDRHDAARAAARLLEMIELKRKTSPAA